MRIATILAAAILILAAMLPPAVLAGTQGAACSPSDTTKVLAWENRVGDTSDGNDALWVCSSLSQMPVHTLPGTCHAGLISPNTWNDCISSVSLWLPSGWRACFYPWALYDGFLESWPGPYHGERVNLAHGDQVESVKLTSGSCV